MLRKFFIKQKLQKCFDSALERGSSNARALLLVDAQAFDIQQIRTNFHRVFGNRLELVGIHFTKLKKQVKANPKAYYGPQDFSYLGAISSETLQEIVEKEYEFVFQFFSKEQVYLSYISAKAKTNLRIGYPDAHPKLTDLFLKVDKDDLGLFFKEANTYLQIIKNSA